MAMDLPLPQLPVGDVFAIAPASEPRSPLVVASPHSGLTYPADFLALSALDPVSLRRSEDTFVDELFASAPGYGATLIKALFPRAFLDVNREPYELDPTMFDGSLPSFVNAMSPRVAAGLGTIPRVVASGAEIYRNRLPAGEGLQRIRDYYFPYHDALTDLIAQTKARFGYCLLLDCHSMPSMDGPSEDEPSRVDIVLGDGYGATCAGSLTERSEALLAALGYHVVRNSPYAGGFTTRHYGVPDQGVHALQIEISRLLYMDELTHFRGPLFSRLEQHMSLLVATLAKLPSAGFLP